MKRIVTLSLLAIACLTMQAQEKDVIVLAKSDVFWVSKPQVATDKKTKKTFAVWPRTEKDDWFEPSGLWVENVPTVDNVEEIFPDVPFHEIFLEDKPLTPMSWQLNEENGETVLHCYFHMPADIVQRCAEACPIVRASTPIINSFFICSFFVPILLHFQF